MASKTGCRETCVVKLSGIFVARVMRPNLVGITFAGNLSSLLIPFCATTVPGAMLRASARNKLASSKNEMLLLS